MEQPQKQQPLEITVTRTFEQSTRVIGEDKMPATGIFYQVFSANGDLSPPNSRYKYKIPSSLKWVAPVRRLYTLVQLSDLGHWEAMEVWAKLKEERVKNVAGITKLEDGSFEVVVLVTYLPTLQDKLGKEFPGSKVDPSYAPYDGSEIDSFLQRSQDMIRDPWPTAAAYYSHLRIMASVKRWHIRHWECHKVKTCSLFIFLSYISIRL